MLGGERKRPQTAGEEAAHLPSPAVLFGSGGGPVPFVRVAERGQVQAAPLPQLPGFPLARHLQESEARRPPLGGGGGGRDQGAAAQACQVAAEAAAGKLGGGPFGPRKAGPADQGEPPAPLRGVSGLLRGRRGSLPNNPSIPQLPRWWGTDVLKKTLDHFSDGDCSFLWGWLGTLQVLKSRKGLPGGRGFLLQEP